MFISNSSENWCQNAILFYNDFKNIGGSACSQFQLCPRITRGTNMSQDLSCWKWPVSYQQSCEARIHPVHMLQCTSQIAPEVAIVLQKHSSMLEGAQPPMHHPESLRLARPWTASLEGKEALNLPWAWRRVRFGQTVVFLGQTGNRALQSRRDPRCSTWSYSKMKHAKNRLSRYYLTHRVLRYS